MYHFVMAGKGRGPLSTFYAPDCIPVAMEYGVLVYNIPILAGHFYHLPILYPYIFSMTF
jgi:hypothetical protein